MIEFLSLILIIFGVLQIILFFKIWGMTNDVKELKNHFCSIKQQNHATAERIDNKPEWEIEKYDKRLDTIVPGDKVAIPGGKEVIVDSIDGNRLFCKTGALSGYKYFKKSEVKYIEKWRRPLRLPCKFQNEVQ